MVSCGCRFSLIGAVTGNIGQPADPAHVGGRCAGAHRGHLHNGRSMGSRACAQTNLPAQFTTFIGRTDEIETARRLLARGRLVTLTGPGGAGKTRLAAAVAAAEASRRPDGIWWVDLAAVTDGTAVAETAAAAVGALVAGDPVHSLIVHLAHGRVLLCLDNAEHLLDGVAGVVDVVLRACPEVTILVTSREPLGLPGEAVLAVPPLGDDDAVALFVDRARLANGSFTLDAANASAVRSIAAHLDGIPLALELAASWLRTLTPQQIEAALDDRFALLVRGPRGALRRQRTLAGSIDWSHDLLEGTDRIVFRRLAVFAGTFGLRAARVVAAGGSVRADDVLPALARLVDKSLVVADNTGEEARYRLLETLRAYATARLVEAAEAPIVRVRHVEWYLRFAESTDAYREHDPDRWRRTLRLEYDNLRTALEQGLTFEDGESGRRLAAALAWLWHLDRRGHEGMDIIRRAIALAPDDRSLLQARLLTGLALVADTAEPLDVEYDAATRALELATAVGDEGLRALCLNLSAVGAFYTDFDEGWRLCEQAHQAARTAANAFVLGGARALQAIILHLRDRHTEAEAIVDDDVRRHLQLHRGVLSTVLSYQAGGALATGDVDRATDLATEALRIAEPLGDYLRVGAARAILAEIRGATGDLDGAADMLGPLLQLLDGADPAVFVPGLSHAMGALAMRRDDPTTAITWLETGVRSTDRGVPTWLAARDLPALGAALHAVGRDEEAAAALNAAVDVAMRLGMPGPLAEAYQVQAELAAVAADPGRALQLDHIALALRVEHGLRACLPDSLEALARHGAAVNATADDVRLLIAAESARAALRLPRAPYQQRLYDDAVRLLRSHLGGPAFDDAAAEGTRLTLDEAVAYARRTRGARGRLATGWSSLTPTELEVVHLVAAGLTNPQIGARLFMSRSTVKTHLAHVFAKLNTANRTELATMAIAHRSSEKDGVP